MNKIQQTGKWAFLTVFIWPFLGLILSLKERDKSWAKNIFWIACIYMGSVHIFNPLFESRADGVSYAKAIVEYSQIEFTLTALTDKMFLENLGKIDIYQPLLTLIISRFTTNAHVLFAIFALVFGFFYSRTLWYVIERIPKQNGFLIGILLFYFVVICSIWCINGVRMATAYYVFTYGAIPYILEKDKSKLFWVFVSVFFHYSFIYAISVFVLFLFIPKKFNLLFILYFITLFVQTINLDIVREYLLKFLPSSYEKVINIYTNKEVSSHVFEARDSVGWHVKLAWNSVKVVSVLLIFQTFFIIKKYYMHNQGLVRLFTFTLLIYCFSNIFALVPSGYRYLIFSSLFLFPCSIFCLSHLPKYNIHRKLIIYVLPLLSSIIFELRFAMDFYGISVIAGNFITSLFWEDRSVLINFIKDFF